MEKITDTAQLPFLPFPIPGATVDKLFAQVLNQDLSFGPVFAILELQPGAYIPAHIHHRTAEQTYVLEGDFINDGISYGPGTFFCHDIGQKHGPHTTLNGCKVIFTQPVEVDPSDFEIAE